ncbi:hypothetical protein GCM10020358_45750 [Amorphoplanes nipponensis]|uniref:Uncharacterized protein n=1 Tax=Actinoplanes nipponensis TaxID=135950 RepID=A0A919JM39_9ACTN|nr:hypothetical protein [Actinoplanes nipponensis]GIE53549.1 hypothetical protein Ani05nite_70830 [Actinoplanes nipponensis]
MPEELTEEQTRAAFADLRAADLTFIRPPGSAEALRTVRRRRRAGVVAAAAGAGLVLAGSATVAARVDPDRAAPAAPSPAPSALSDAELDRLSEAAAAALGLTTVDNKKRRSQGLPRIVSSNHGPLRGGDQGVAGVSSGTNQTGVYVVEVVCVGTGTLHALVWAADGISRDRPVPPGAADVQVSCGDRPTPVEVTVSAPRPKLVFTRIEPDPSAIGRAAYARLTRHQ